MKIKHLLLGMLAMAATVACKPDQPVEEATLEVSKETVALAATAAEATFEVTSSQDWTATADADWVSLDPATGTASAEAVVVKVTAEDNEAAEARTATVTVKAGELTKTVALTQAGAEGTPEPELPTPNADWTSDAVQSYDLPEGASSKRQLLKNIKYLVDENYLYVKLQASAAEFAAAPAEYLGIFVYDVTNGSGDGYYGWWNDAKGNVELEGEHIGTFNGKDITLTIGETPVEVITEENGDELVWTMNILRSAHENLALENPYFAFLTYIGWEPNGALPDKYEDMLQYTPAPKPVEPVTEGVIWENTNGVGPTSWQATTPYRFSIEGGDSQNECIAEIPAAVWAGMKTTPFTVNITPDATKEWWQVRILDGWWTTDDGGTNDITPEYAGLVNYGDGTYAFQVDLSTKPELVNLMDTQHLLFTGDAYTINKIYFGEPEPAPVDVDIDGKQWLFTWEAMGGISTVIDLGVTEPGVAILAYDMGALDPSYAGIYYPYMVGLYSVTKTDGTSGVIALTDLESGAVVEIPYSNATENSVHLASAELLYEDVDCTLATSKIEIPMEVAEYLPDGEYWIMVGDKVASPLTSNYGYLQVTTAVDGKSYAANAFTFTMVDAGLYTIQDANGKYYYQTGTYNSFNVSDKDGGTDEYLWEVYDTGNGQYAIINCGVGKFVQYDASYNSYGSYAEEKGTLPTLVLAENPIPEPEPEPEPEPTPTPEGASYVKVTADQDDWSGKYLIVFGSNAHASLTSKDLNSTAAVTIEGDAIAATADLNSAVMTVTKNGDKYVMTFADGKYFGMQHNGCKLMTSAFDLNFAYTSAGVKISGYVTDKSNTYILYHNSNNGNYYRCYVDKNGQSGYTLPTLYKLSE